MDNTFKRLCYLNRVNYITASQSDEFIAKLRGTVDEQAKAMADILWLWIAATKRR